MQARRSRDRGPDATNPTSDDEWDDRTDQVKLASQFAAFHTTPEVGDCLYLALSEAVPSCAVALQVTCHIDGVGVDPDNPPLVWEAWNGTAWDPCDVDHDDTGGLNRDGQIVLHVPRTHVVSVFREERGGYLRARVVEAESGQPSYTSSPLIHGMSATTVGGTTDAVHAELVRNEALGAVRRHARPALPDASRSGPRRRWPRRAGEQLRRRLGGVD